MADPQITTPLDVLACGKRQLEALLDLEPNKRIRAVIAEQLADYLTVRALELKNTPIRPSQQFAASRALAEPHNVGEIKDALQRDTPVVEPPIETTRRHPKDRR